MNYQKTVSNKGKKSAKRITEVPEIDNIKSQLRQLESELMLTMVQITLNHPAIVSKRLQLDLLDRELNQNLKEFGFIE